MMKTLPQQISYGQKISPIGYPAIYKQWRLAPMSSNKQWAKNDIVRFLFQNLGNGVVDPYRSYIQITVACNKQQMQAGLVQMDNSAQSFIQQLVAYSNNSQVQRITHYSVLAAYLADIGYNQFVTQGRQMQGMGHCSFSTPPFQNKQTAQMGMRYNKGNAPLISHGSPTIIPTMSKQVLDSTHSQNANQSSGSNMASSLTGHISNSNPVIFENDISYQSQTPVTIKQDMMNGKGYMANMRAQYVANYQNNKFIDSSTSIPNVNLGVSHNVHKGQYPYGYQKNKPYQTEVKKTIQSTLYGQDNVDTVSNTQYQLSSSLSGYSTLFSPMFSKGTFQPFISPTVPQNQIKNGLILRTRQPVHFRRFKIPILSGIFGILIDEKSYMLIPLQALNTMMVQFTLDPHAMFTSGYSDYSQFDMEGMATPQKRNYEITRIQYRLQTYHYSDQQINEFIQTSLLKQITFTSTMWSLGNMFQIPGGTGPNSNYTVGCSSLFLNQIVCLFVSNDYQIYPFCRKHFRNSNCILKYWCRIGPDYFPPQPYQGNGGNPYPSVNDYQSDNSVFIQNIYWANDYMFDKSNPLPRINPFNFALNDRPYNPTNKNTFYDQGIQNNPNYTWTSSSIKSDTAMGMSWVHQNRAVGKAAYLIPFQPYSNKDKFLSGLNVRNVNNLQVLFQSDAQYPHPRDQSLYIFCKSAVSVTLNRQQILVIGR